MNKKQQLSEWFVKIEKDGIPNKKIFQIVWKDVIKILKNKLISESWQNIEDYVKRNKETFSEVQKMAGPDALQKVFNQISAKIWSINNKTKEVN